MNKKLIIGFVIAVLSAFWALKVLVKKSSLGDQSPALVKVHQKSYWTCPMHPQIHLDHPGECPICRMKLVEILEQEDLQTSSQDPLGHRASFYGTPAQLLLIDFQKHTVESMNLTATIPVSGRILSTTTVAFQVYENDLRYIHAGMSFEGKDSVYLEKEVSGVIRSVDSIVDPTSRTIRVVGEIKNGQRNLIPETGFRGEIKIALIQKLAIPASSVLHTGQGSLIYLVDSNNKLTPKRIELGLKTDGYYEVLSGLKLGDVISAGPNFLVDSEAKIRGTND